MNRLYNKIRIFVKKKILTFAKWLIAMCLIESKMRLTLIIGSIILSALFAIVLPINHFANSGISELELLKCA